MILQFPEVSAIEKEEKRVKFQQEQLEEQTKAIQKLHERLRKKLERQKTTTSK
jgi:hypothetical protein|tara:strand:+ start:77 stop:235 length:159 start_codon:yes stop_codon:yes gene_type:complete